MSKNLFLGILGCIGLLCGKANAQDIHFSQFYENSTLRNPALTGIFSGDYKASVNYRTQWANISVPFRTVLASAETRIAINREVGDYLSFGLTMTYDRAGSINFNSLQVYPAINYNKALEGEHNTYLSVGFTGGYIQRSIDFSKATFSSQFNGSSYDPLTGSGENMNNTMIQNYDLGAGISINSSAGENNTINYYIGAAAYHVTKPKHSFNADNAFIRLDTKWQGNLGFKCAINQQVTLTLHSNYSRQGTYQEIIFGGLVGWRSPLEKANGFSIYAGLFGRLNDAMIPTTKIDYQRYSVTVSYDVNTSGLRPASDGAGGFEMTLTVRGKYNRVLQSSSQVRCPHFEQMMGSQLSGFNQM